MSLSALEQAYADHAAWGVIEQLDPALDEVPEDLRSAMPAVFERLRFLSNYLLAFSENFTPLVSSRHLEALQNSVQNAVTSVNQCTQNRNIEYLRQADTHADSAVDATRAWPQIKDKYMKGTLQTAKRYQEDAEAAIEEVREDLRGVSETRKELRDELLATQAELEQVRALVAEQAAAQQKTVATQIERLDAALNGHQDTFSRAEIERGEKFSTALTELEEELKSLASKQMTEGERHIASLVELKEKATLLVDAVGLTATATEYGKYAEEQRNAANKWRIVAASAFIASFALFLVVVLFGHVTGDLPWQQVALRAGASVALLGLGLYASRESGQHRQQERIAKDKQLDLAALDPFIANLDEVDQQAIKIAAAKRLFSESRPVEGPPTAASPTLSASQIGDAVIALLDRLKK
jgi:DNA repair exonuclease SbcCD ATPase subunit